MKNLTEFLLKKSIICKKLEKLENRKFNIRKKIEIYKAVTTKSSYILIFYINRKSRISQKEIRLIDDISIKVIEQLNMVFKNKILIIDSPFCKKAQILSKELKWKVIN